MRDIIILIVIGALVFGLTLHFLNIVSSLAVSKVEPLIYFLRGFVKHYVNIFVVSRPTISYLDISMFYPTCSLFYTNFDTIGKLTFFNEVHLNLMNSKYIYGNVNKIPELQRKYVYLKCGKDKFFRDCIADFLNNNPQVKEHIFGVCGKNLDKIYVWCMYNLGYCEVKCSPSRLERPVFRILIKEAKSPIIVCSAGMNIIYIFGYRIVKEGDNVYLVLNYTFDGNKISWVKYSLPIHDFNMLMSSTDVYLYISKDLVAEFDLSSNPDRLAEYFFDISGLEVYKFHNNKFLFIGVNASNVIFRKVTDVYSSTNFLLTQTPFVTKFYESIYNVLSTPETSYSRYYLIVPYYTLFFYRENLSDFVIGDVFGNEYRVKFKEVENYLRLTSVRKVIFSETEDLENVFKDYYSFLDSFLEVVENTNIMINSLKFINETLCNEEFFKNKPYDYQVSLTFLSGVMFFGINKLINDTLKSLLKSEYYYSKFFNDYKKVFGYGSKVYGWFLKKYLSLLAALKYYESVLDPSLNFFLIPGGYFGNISLSNREDSSYNFIDINYVTSIPDHSLVDTSSITFNPYEFLIYMFTYYNQSIKSPYIIYDVLNNYFSSPEVLSENPSDSFFLMTMGGFSNIDGLGVAGYGVFYSVSSFFNPKNLMMEAIINPISLFNFLISLVLPSYGIILESMDIKSMIAFLNFAGKISSGFDCYGNLDCILNVANNYSNFTIFFDNFFNKKILTFKKGGTSFIESNVAYKNVAFLIWDVVNKLKKSNLPFEKVLSYVYGSSYKNILQLTVLTHVNLIEKLSISMLEKDMNNIRNMVCSVIRSPVSYRVYFSFADLAKWDNIYYNDAGFTNFYHLTRSVGRASRRLAIDLLYDIYNSIDKEVVVVEGNENLLKITYKIYKK